MSASEEIIHPHRWIDTYHYKFGYTKCPYCGDETGWYNPFSDRFQSDLKNNQREYCPKCGKRVYAREGWLMNQPPMVALLDPEDAVSAIENLPSAQPNMQPTCNQLATVAKDICVPCKDSISRQAAIAVADYTDCTGLAIEDVKKVTDEVVKGLKQLPSAQQNTCEYWDDESNFCALHRPSAQPERKTGRWILYDNQRQEEVENGNYLYICSECGKSDIHAKTQEVPFCWWCGADMKGDQDDK